jgi:hypothetical protein
VPVGNRHARRLAIAAQDIILPHGTPQPEAVPRAHRILDKQSGSS